jgi:hypothetical protein
LIARVGVDLPFTEANPCDGIIAYLTRKHDGNIHNKGIITITSKSVWSREPTDAVGNLPDFAFDRHFKSKNERGQWVCWDFREMRIRPTHYTIKSVCLKSWEIESSLDGIKWTAIDKRIDNKDYTYGFVTNTFAVAKSDECRFIKLTQTGQRHVGDDCLVIVAFELFGALIHGGG